MNYYYDVKLNFLDNYYRFYDWMENDKIKLIKKIPIFLIDNKTLRKIIDMKVKIEKETLSMVINKTKIENGIIKYALLLTDGTDSIALIFNRDGESIFYSHLLLDDEINIEELSYTLKKQVINFEVINELSVNNFSRRESHIVSYIKEEIDRLVLNNNENKLKYLYNELFDLTLESDYIDKIYSKLEKSIDDKLYNLYKIIKLSYNNA